MSAEAFARLRFEVETALDTFGEKHPALNNTLLRVSPNDLRALLDAHAALEAARAALLSLLPGDTHVNQHGVDWSLACGRRYLSVAGWVVAMEGDVSREVKSKARSWDGEEFKAIVEQFAEPIRKALAAMDKAKP